MHREATDVVLDELDLTGVDADTDLQSQNADAVPDRGRTAQRRDRTLESGYEAVPGGVDLVATETIELRPDQAIVLAQQLSPAAVAQAPGSGR